MYTPLQWWHLPQENKMFTTPGSKDWKDLQCVQQGTFFSAEPEAAHDCKAWSWSSRSSLSCLWKTCQISWHARKGEFHNIVVTISILDWLVNVLKVQHAEEGRPAPIECSFEGCDVKVNSKNMKMHMSTHTGEKEECGLCGQWLRCVADHMRTVHKTGKQKPCTGVSCVFFDQS